jgi:hypothetical protein
MKKMSIQTSKRFRYSRMQKEDMRILQKKLSGVSVYGAASMVYKRIPKHKKRAYAYNWQSVQGSR